MSSLKKLLKSAKISIEQNDPQSALEYSDEALELDSNCFFAYLFKGKSYQLLRDVPKAIIQFKRATEIEPENLLAWKGYFQTVRASNDYVLFFNVLTKLVKLLRDQDLGIGETLRDLRNYLDLNKYKENEVLYELYLNSIIPGSELGELIGSSLGSGESNVQKLLDFKKSQLDKQVQTRISKERVKFGRNLTVEQKQTLDSIAWEYYKDGQLTKIYELFLNICNDDELRRKYEEEFLKYRYELLKVCPEKNDLFNEIKQTIEDMILVNTKSLFCWNLYFDWCDTKTIFELDEDNIIAYLRIFQNEGLGLILFAFIMSEISPYNKERIIAGMSYSEKPKKKKQVIDEEDAEALQNLEEPQEDFSQYYLPPDEILGYILEGYSKSKDSILANRIIVNYYIHLREYDTASERCRDGIRLLAEIQRTFGINLLNTKEDFLCSLAIVYTYYEAPKNFNRALQLYDKILESNNLNFKAKVGKGLIFVEQGDLQQAKLILEEVLQEHPENSEAKLEYNWCLINLGQFEQGKQGLENFLSQITGTDLYSGELRAKAHWRLAKGYFMQDDTNQDNIKQCYTHLIQSLKYSESYAPSYTLLGILFHEYYGDFEKSQKCFFKAFDLDVNEIIAAKYLVEKATAKNEWDVAQVLAKRVITSESSRRLILRPSSDDRDNSWPYRVLGCGSLNIQDDAKAVEYFQNALRINAQDFECWVGLGEAYYNCGRYDAAAKVFHHAIAMKEESEIPWTVKYLLGVVTCEMKEFNEGLTYLYDALTSKPNEECIITAIYEAQLENTGKYMQSGFFGRAVDSSLKALEFIKTSIMANSMSQKVWKSLGDCLQVFIKVQSNINKFPFDDIVTIFNHIEIDDVVLDISLDESISLTHAIELFNQDKKIESVVIFNILCATAGVKYLPAKVNKALRSTALYNLGLSLLQAYQSQEIEPYKDSAIFLFKKAIQLENNNVNYWLALGNAYFYTNPHISQHCYIKATTLEVKDGGIWINLATLFLKYGDLELAQQAFLRAQSVAHQGSQAWLGQAIAFEILGDKTKAFNYYTHAFTLSKGKLAVAQFLYGLSVINKRIGGGFDPRDVETAQEFGISNQAMQQYLKYKPNDEDALAISLTIAERCKDFDHAIKLGSRLCEILERKYEETEQESILENFSLVKSQIARIYLGMNDYRNALENAQMALQLIEGGEIEHPEITLSCHITIGLSYFFTSEFESSIQELKLILSQHNSSQRIVTLIAQILYAHGTEESKQASIDQLFAHIEENGSSLLVVLTLGAISLVENYQEYLGAIKEELQGLSLGELVNDTYRDVPRLLTEINTRLNGREDKSVWLKYAYLFPFDYNVWKNVSNEMAKSVISLQDVKVNGLQYSEALLKSGDIRDIQRSLILTPGNLHSMEALKQCTI